MATNIDQYCQQCGVKLGIINYWLSYRGGPVIQLCWNCYRVLSETMLEEKEND